MTMRIAYILLISIFSLTAYTQEVAHYEVFDIEDGLPSNEVYLVEEDADGYLWLATDRGVAKFDGQDFEIYTSDDGLVDDCILYAHCDEKNRLWFQGLSGKLSVLENGHFSDFKGNDVLYKLNMPRLRYGISFQSPGKKYFSYFNRSPLGYPSIAPLLVYNDATGLLDSIPSWYFNESEKVECFHVGDGVIVRWQETTFYYEFDSIVKSLPKTKQFARFRETLFPLEEISHQSGMVNSKLYASKIRGLTLKDGNYYITTNSGFSSFSYADKQSPTIKTLIPDINATRSFVDRENNLWIATVNSGLIKIPNDNIYKFDHFSTTTRDHPISLRTLNDNLLVGTENGMLCVIDSSNTIKIIADNCLFRRFPEHFQKINLIEPRFLLGNIERSSHSDHGYHLNDNIHFTFNLILRNSKNKIVSTKKSFGVAQANKNIWIASVEGLHQLNYTKRGYENEYELDSIYHLHHRVSDVRTFKKGVVYSVMGNGLYYLDDGRSYLLSHSKLDKKMINCLKVENDSTIWVGTTKGLIRTNIKMESNQIYINKAKRYTTKEGIISNFILDIEKYMNQIWVATPKGLMYFDPKKIDKTSTAPLIYLNMVRINNRVVNFASSDLTHLSYDENSIKVDFSGVSNQRPSDFPFYHYTLDKNESQIETNSQDDKSLNFSDLAPGTYQLRLWASNRLKLQSSPIQLNWVIHRHWTNTNVFFGFVILAFLGVVYLFFRRRIQKIRKEKQLDYQMKDLELRSLRSQLNPHFIFNVLNSIQLYIYQNNQKEAGSYLKKFANLMRSFLEQSKLDFIDIQEEIDFLNQYLSLEKIRIEDKLEFTVSQDLGLKENILLPSLILQPLIENAVKHGVAKGKGPGWIQVNFAPSSYENYVQVEIINSGPAFNQQKNDRGQHKKVHGMTLIEERIDLLKSYFGYALTSMTVTSPVDHELNEGTQVTVILPIKGRQ